MKHVSKYLLALLVLLPLANRVAAQSLRKIIERPVHIVRSEWEQDREGNQELNYYNEDYCNYYLYRLEDEGYKLKPGKNTVFTKKKDGIDNPFQKASSYYYYRGSFPKSFNIETVYALPVKNGKRTAWRTDRRESLRTLEFRMQEGDTVYATRSGVACCTILPRHLLICHDDETFAAYMVMAENFISPGDRVQVGQPVGVTGPTGVAISFFFLDKNKFDGQQAVGYPYSHFQPVFRTTEGDVKMVEKKMYESLIDDALMMQDMSKREQKKYLKNKK